MKKIILSLALVIALVGAAAALERSLGVERYTSVDEIAGAFSAYFPKVQGEVTSVAQDSLEIAMGSKEGLQAGVALTLWRDSKEILHPVTSAVIGRLEEEIGVAEVTLVGEKTSTAVVTRKNTDPKPGDKARITPKKIRIALIPLQSDRPEIIQALSGRLTDFGRFTVLDADTTAAFLKDRKQRDGSLVREMGKAHSLDVVAAVEVYPSEGKYLVTTRIFYAADARLLDTIVAVLDLRTKKDALGEVRPFFAPVKEAGTATSSGTTSIPLDSQFFAAADLEGSGKLQYVLSDGMRIHIFRQDGAAWREAWAELGVYGAGEMQHINVDVADINGNGKPEIFVTCMRNGRVISYVIELKDGAYRRIAEVQGFLRVVKYSGSRNILIGRDYHPESFYKGPIKRYGWSDGTYVAAEEFPLPKAMGLYGFTYADLGELMPQIVALDDEDHLVVYSNNVPIWKSEEKYPAVGVTVMKPVTGVDAAISREAAEGDKRLQVRIPGRVVAMDLNGDNRDEIVLPKNSGKTLLTPHKKAELVGLNWTGSRLDERWNVKEETGAVQDFQVVKPEGAVAQFVALVRHPGGFFKSDRMSIMTYDIK